MMNSSKIVITGGGSGGHTITALGVVDALIDSHPELRERIVYIGGQKGMEGEKNAVSFEERMVREKGLPFIPVRSGKLQRKISLRTVIGLFGVVGGFVDAIKFFSRNLLRKTLMASPKKTCQKSLNELESLLITLVRLVAKN